MDSVKQYLVLGTGMTGKSAATFLQKRGLPFLWVDEEGKTVPPAGADAPRGTRTEFRGIDLAIASPHYTNRWVLYELEKQRIPILSDIEIFYRLSKSPILAVTGTNGKSTTVSLLHDILSRCGKSLLLGNIGIPCLDYIEKTAQDVPAVLETSSFQLARTELFRPRIAAILNVTPDHLDFHKTFSEYRAAKYRIAKNQTAGDYLVLNADQPLRAPETQAEVMTFSTEKPADACISDGWIVILEHKILPAEELRLPGRHNLSNALCAGLMAKLYGVSDTAVARSFREFGGIPHRLEFLRCARGKVWINDSKSTNIASCEVATEAFRSKKICLIAGGRSAEDFDSFVLRAAKKACRVLAFGESAQRIAESCRKFGYQEVTLCSDLAECVMRAAEGNEEIVLFSPACKSFDGFSNFEERGERFRELVQSL